LETELNGGTELANVMAGEFALDRPTLAEATGGRGTLTPDSEYEARGGTLAGADFTTAAVLLPGGPTRMAARLLSVAFLS